MSAGAHRRLGLITAICGVGGLAGAAFLPWWRRDYDDPLTGALSVTVDGAAVAALLVPLALVVAAGYCAAALSGGVLRRVIGAVTGAAGLVAVMVSIRGAAVAPIDALTDQLSRPAAAIGGAALTMVSPAVAVAGALCALCCGVVLATGHAPTRSRRYDGPAQRRAVTAAGTPSPQDDTDLWRALDAGTDPTDDGGDAPRS